MHYVNTLVALVEALFFCGVLHVSTHRVVLTDYLKTSYNISLLIKIFFFDICIKLINNKNGENKVIFIF